MQLFRCDHCGNVVYFENTVCERCGHALGYWYRTSRLLSLDPDTEAFRSPSLPGQRFVFCGNAQYGACNWLVEYTRDGPALCRACRHNGVIPPTGDPQSLARWQTIERAKKRLFYALLRFRLPLATRAEDATHGLSFEFLNEDIAAEPVMTGHASGVITIALKEADDAAREYRRTQLHEPYRTLLGHFRHEVGHHFWDILIGASPEIESFRALFGDERDDYGEALERYYADGPSPDWHQTSVSAYATSHPWEDWAETWAHLLHIVDTLDVASAFGLSLLPPVDRSGGLSAHVDFDAYERTGSARLMKNWVPLASLVNNLNRAVGANDPYPFVLNPKVVEKLTFIQRVVLAAGDVQWTVPGANGPLPINHPRAASPETA